ncbi:type II toxin-antitoxin system CcdA family antitoxin [Halorarum salinum]|uniref:Type II toxin-antitoxin system CcdA family antitoxin n=1 Tax=Halorarum salinum TaxID=2743089 RepID=A0A7D5LAN9_9EURY|nr:type II toxin-antitoxin system CcdA family antitoxin [Halobaculum salinum]QLG61990.1 type II toxin-antitoxin system CcdA family antitoxin [Halobaculum salinum]
MARTTVSIDDDLIERAKDAGLNVSQVSRRALKETLNAPAHHLFNTNERYLPHGQTGAGVYGHGVVATFADSNNPDDVDNYGGHIGEIETADKIYSWENGHGLRAVGIALEDGSSDPVPLEHRLFHSASSDVHEFHAPVHWVAVLDQADAVTTDEIKRVSGRPVFAGVAHREMNDNDFPELLWDIVVGRATR